MKINKQKLRKWLYIYLVSMLVLIFSSRTIYNFTIPRVHAVNPTSGRLTKELEVRGMVTLAETFDIFAASSGQLDEIFIKKGDIIDENTLIATYLVGDETISQAAELDFAIARIENHMDSLTLSRTVILTKLRALNDTTPSGLHNYQWAVADAKTELEKRRRELMDAQKIHTIADTECDCARKPNINLSEAEKNVRNAQTALERAEINLETVIKAHEDQINETKNMLNIDLQRIDLDIERAKIDLDATQLSFTPQDLNKGTGVTFNSSGIVLSVEKKRGQFVTKGEKIATIGVDNNMFITEIICTEVDGRFIEIGDTAGIHKSGFSSTIQAKVYDMELVGESLKIRLMYETKELSDGDYVTIRFQKLTDIYNTIVPNEAIFHDGINSFVWTVHSRQGALGIEYISMKHRVIIADMDDFYTAISRGLEFVAPIVVNHDKDLTVNGRVTRLE